MEALRTCSRRSRAAFPLSVVFCFLLQKRSCCSGQKKKERKTENTTTATTIRVSARSVLCSYYYLVDRRRDNDPITISAAIRRPGPIGWPAFPIERTKRRSDGRHEGPGRVGPRFALVSGLQPGLCSWRWFRSRRWVLSLSHNTKMVQH